MLAEKVKTIIFKNKTVQNAGWLIGGKIFQMLISFLVSVITARYLGPSNYGLINYAGAYTAFFMAFCTLGINSVLVREFVNNPEREGEIIGTALGLRALSSLLSALMIIGLVTVIDHDDPIAIIVVALCSLSLVFKVFDTFNYWFQSKLQSKVTAIASFIAYFITSAYKVILIITGKSVEWFALATSVDYIILAVVLYGSYRIYNGGRISFSATYGKYILKCSSPFIFPSIMVAIYGYTDKLMLKHMMSEAEVGYYSTAAALCGIWTFVLSAIIDSVYPSIMEAYKTDIKQFEKRNRQLYAIIFYISLFVSLVITVLAEIIIVILYDRQYLGAVNPMRIITWYTAFSFLGVARNAWVVCENKQKYLKYLYLASAILNIILNTLLIPILSSSGAALASLITQIATIFIPFFIKDMRRNTVLMIQAITLQDIR